MRAGVTALSVGLLCCRVCGQLSRQPDGGGHVRCPRCNAPLHARRPASMSTTWALTLAAMLLYLPANLLPIMLTSSFLGSQQDTILSGVVLLWRSGSWPLALVVFFASVMVPLLKILALLHLLLSVQRRSTHRLVQRARLYRLIEFVGRWSMLDIYVIVILVALVRFQGLATVEAGPAALSFAGVVILTMLAALSFDPRLMWDPVSPPPASARENTRD